MERLSDQAIQAHILPVEDKYLRTRYSMLPDGVCEIRVGRGYAWTPLQVKEVYGKAIKTCQELELTSAAADLTAAADLGGIGVSAAIEGLYGGAYHEKFSLTGQWQHDIALYACGEGFSDRDLTEGTALAQAIMEARNRVNCPANILSAAAMPASLEKLAEGLPVEVRIYRREELGQLGLRALLAVGDSAASPSSLAVLRYTGSPMSEERLGLVGKGVATDSGGYSLKAAGSMANIKADMAGGAAAAATVCALAACGVPVNATAVVPIVENRISPGSLLPGDVITSYSGKTIEVLNADAEGRLILADALTWAVRQEGCTRLVDIATLTGAIYAMLGHVATGVMANDDAWYASLTRAAEASGERFWRMPTFPEYEPLIQSSFADLRNTSKDGCGAITAGLFLRHFTEGLPWLHLDIAGTAESRSVQWQHQSPGATGAPVSTLFFLAKGLADE